MDKLLACPCCNGESDCNNAGIQTKDGTPLWWVECLECGLSTEGHETREQAIAVWNRRPEAENKPLTLEQLRGMDGEPVWCEHIGDTTKPSQWAVYNHQFDCCSNKEWDFYVEDAPDEAYGKTWLAYDRPPRTVYRIDATKTGADLTPRKRQSPHGTAAPKKGASQ